MPCNDVLVSYCSGVLDGSITACDKLKRGCERLLADMSGREMWHYDPVKAARPVEFIERFCCLPSGKIGSPMLLEPFQKAWLNSAFGFVDDDGLRKYREVFTLVARKNGKSSLLSAIMLYMLMADGEGSPQVVSAATKADQARLTYEAAYKMVLQSPALQAHLQKRMTDIYCPVNMGKLKPLSSNAHSLDGLDVHLGVLDELAAWQYRDVYDLIRQAVSARSQPLIWSITTNNFVREGVFDNIYEHACNVINGLAKDERFLPWIYELDDEKEIYKPEAWRKANPGLGTIKSEEYLQEIVERTRTDISIYPTVAVKEFDLKQTGESSWLRWGDFAYEESNEDFDPADFDYYIGGFDAADTLDLNAAKALFFRKNDPHIYVKSMYWLPEEQLTKTELSGLQRERDNMPYKQWVKRGLMRVVPGNRVPRSVFLEWFTELRDKYGCLPLRIGYDPWHVTEDDLKALRGEFGKRTLVYLRQGVKTLSEPMKELKCELMDHNIIYGGNPIDRMCFINTAIKTDINGNIQPVKALGQSHRIDGLMALLFAYTVYRNNKTEVEEWAT